MRHLVVHGTRAVDAHLRQWKFDPLHQTRSPQPTYAVQARAFWCSVSCPVLYVEGTESDLRLPPADLEERLTALHAQRARVCRDRGIIRIWNTRTSSLGCWSSFSHRRRGSDGAGPALLTAPRSPLHLNRGGSPPMALTLGIVPFWKNYDRKAVLRAAQLAEDLGYDSIWIPEAWAYEQFQLLAEIATVTKRLKLATGIANVFSRSPGLLAMSAATLDEISEGRVILGLGTSGKVVVENFHGVAYAKPLTRLRETVGIMRALWRGDRLSPEMSTLFEARHFKLEMRPFRSDIPVYIASLQDKAIHEIGRIADGWVPTFWPYTHLGDGIAMIAAGARQAGRDPQRIAVAPFMAVIPLDDVAVARSMIKPLVSFYIGGMGTYYHALFCRYGFKDNVDLVRDLYKAGSRREAAAAVADDLIDAVAICGPPAHCREKLAEWQAHGITAALLNLPTGVPDDVTEQVLRTLAPAA